MIEEGEGKPNLWRMLGNIEKGVEQLLKREDVQDRRITAVEKKVWMFTGAATLVAALSLRWEALKAFFVGH